MIELIKSFVEYFSIVEGWTITLSVFAIGISLKSIFDASFTNRRQIRINKLEEMIEIIILIMSNYMAFDDIYLLQRKIEIVYDLPETKDLIEREKKLVNSLRQISNEIKLSENLIRLGILSNIYLPNADLKNRIRSLITLISCIQQRTIYRNKTDTYKILNTFPRAWNLLPYVETLLTDISKEMKLGYESNLYGENPHFEKFKKDLELK